MVDNETDNQKELKDIINGVANMGKETSPGKMENLTAEERLCLRLEEEAM